MSNIQRYGAWPQEWPFEDAGGDLVTYEYHRKIVDELEAKALANRVAIMRLEAKLVKAVCLITGIEAGPSWGESLPSWVNTRMLRARATLAELKRQGHE